MNRGLKLVREMGGRVHHWCTAHLESAGEQFVARVDALGRLLVRADALLVQQVNGKAAVAKATQRRRDVIRALTAGPLRHLMRIARVAAEHSPGVDRHFRVPRGGSQMVIVTTARNMVAETEKERALFQEYGFTEDMLAGVTGLLGEFDQMLEAGDAGRRAHTGARAELEQVSDEIMVVVRELDAMLQLRYRNEPEHLNSWRSARNIHWPLAAQAPTPDAGNKEPAA